MLPFNNPLALETLKLQWSQNFLRLGAEKLSAFAVLSKPDYVLKWYHELICEKLEAVERGEIKFLIITMPPQHGKSELASIKFPAWCLGRKPDRRIICASYAGEVAARFGREVRNTFALPVFQGVFPGVSLAEDSKAANRFNTNRGGYYVAAGRDGAITSFGADILILDDLFKNRQEAYSQTIRDAVWQTYLSVFKTRLHAGSAIVMLMTRWHDDDLIGRALVEEKGKYVLLNVPALAVEDEEHRKKGEALWPEKYPVAYLEDLKKLDPDSFSCLYQQNPLDSENQEFKRSYFKYFQDDECPVNMRIFTTVDPAISKKESADESCVMTVGVTPSNDKFVLEYSHGRWNPSELIQKIFEHYDKYRPIQVGIETVAYQEALAHFLKIEMKKQGKIMRIEEIHSRTDKEVRIRGLIAHYQAGAIYHRAGFTTALEDQLLRFPKGVHDDIIDALAMQQQLWSPPAYTRYKPPKAKSIKDVMREEGILKANQ